MEILTFIFQFALSRFQFLGFSLREWPPPAKGLSAPKALEVAWLEIGWFCGRSLF